VSFTPFYVGTCEARAHDERELPFDYTEETPFKPFAIQDPFGLRTAVVPVFRRAPDGRMFGMGTAFHFDGWGGYLTADHVIDFTREKLPKHGLDPQQTAMLNPAVSNHAVLMLGIGAGWGTVGVPNWAMVPVESIGSMTSEDDDPMAALRGTALHKVITDLAFMQVRFAPETRPTPCSLPIRLSGWQPKVGDQVFAVGFPELKCEEVDEIRMRSLISEGMHGAYGEIIGFHPQGRDLANPTPVFEVEADWPSGMSGGPVFNRAGEVVGVVSRSLLPDGDAKGIGYAACLPAIPQMAELLPTADPSNPGWRLGYGVLRKEPWHLAGVCASMEAAQAFATKLGTAYHVRFGSQRIGTDDFMS
jgi:serine protease Do